MAADVRGEIAATTDARRCPVADARTGSANSSSATRTGRARWSRRWRASRAGIGRAPVSVMHVCGSHEQAIAKFGLRAAFPATSTSSWGPAARCASPTRLRSTKASSLARQGVHIATYGDMVRVPGTVMSLADAQAEGAKVHVIYSADQAVDLARSLGRAGRVLRHRFRNHGGGHGRHRPEGHPGQPVDPLGAQVHPAGHGNRGRDARDEGRGVPRRRARRHDHRAGASSRRSSNATGCRWSSRDSNPSTSWPALVQAARTDPRRHAGGRQHVPALRDARRQPARAGAALEGLPAGGRALARHRPRAQRQPRACATSGRTSTRAGGSRST